MNKKEWQMFLSGFAGVLAGAAVIGTLGGGLRLDPAQPFQLPLVVLAIGLAAYLMFRGTGGARLKSLVNTNGTGQDNPLTALSPSGGQNYQAEEADFAKLISELRVGPIPVQFARPLAAAPLISVAKPAPAPGPAADAPDAVQEFFNWAAETLPAARELIQKCSRADKPAAQRELLVELRDRVAEFKRRAGLPRLRPAWQLAATLDGLLKQLTDRTGDITHSTLRTVAGGLELLKELSVPGIRPDLAVNPPVRILAVDDDSLSRFALGTAVKKAFDEPDVADSGESALHLISLNRYDLIILDVMLAGMDGFEVCARIRACTTNYSTPVLFVTGLKDFDTQAKSLDMTETDLLGKPFLTFEIALKALTLALRSRLRDLNRVLGAAGPSPAGAVPAVSWPDLSRVPLADDKSELVKPPADTLPPPVFSTPSPGEASKTPGPNEPREISPSFRSYVAAMVGELKEAIALIGRTGEGDIRDAMLSQLRLRFQCLVRKIDVPELRPAAALGAALESLFGKFSASSKVATASALRTASMGLELFGDLCQSPPKADLADQPPLRILVVDDEPLARRAINSALQMNFSRPVSVENGEAALALAAAKEFDVVFMDVYMPGMDGFAACAGLHDTPANRATPVVFVTSHSDEQFQAESARCGGSDFVVKPFAFSEIAVKTLTFALRGRLQKVKNAGSQGGPAPADRLNHNPANS